MFPRLGWSDALLRLLIHFMNIELLLCSSHCTRRCGSSNAEPRLKNSPLHWTDDVLRAKGGAETDNEQISQMRSLSDGWDAGVIK